MKVLQIIEDNINVRHIEEIASVLRDGGIIVYPTDTVYAIGCDALNNQAIERPLHSRAVALSVYVSPTIRLPLPSSVNWGIPYSRLRYQLVMTTTVASPNLLPRLWAIALTLWSIQDVVVLCPRLLSIAQAMSPK